MKRMSKQSTKESQSPKPKKLNKTKPSKKQTIHESSVPALERYLNTNVLEGLTSEQIAIRIKQRQLNVVEGNRGKSVGRIIADNLFTFFNMLYFVITILLCLAQSWHNLTYLPVIIPNIIIGIMQEIKAKKTIDKLSLVSAPKATLIRGGEKTVVATNEVVLDDIAYFTSGNQIYADSIIAEGTVEVNESLITGEADPISKGPGDLLYSGSFIVSGTCYARVDHVGSQNYIEKLASEAKKHQPPRSELMRTLKVIIRSVAIIIIPLGALTFYRAWSGSSEVLFFARYTEGIESAAAVIIGMIPSGLFLLTSVALAVGVINLGKNNTLVQELYCIEMLARVDVLCLDKTGTITDGTMRVLDCIEVKNVTDYTIREIIGSMMNAFKDTNPTSEALIRYFDKNSVLKATNLIPFSSKRKYSAATFQNPATKEQVGTFFIGAPEFVLTDQYDKVKTKVERFASQGCRVLVLGYIHTGIKEGQTPKSVKPLALIVIQDHIREQAYATLEYFKNNGVDIKVISGDNPLTVSEIASRAGVVNAERFISLEGLSDEEVTDIALDYTVFGRVSPSQKRVLVRALKAQKKTVAMTGDGVNDILALKEADTSIAMASGSEATRYVSHLVLMDSNFASMPKVVAEGRRVINNIQRTSTLFLVKTIFTILLTIMYIVLNYRYPFQASQLWLIEFFAIGFPAIILAVQPNTEKVQGKFILNVLRRTLPAALTVVLFHGVMYFLSQYLTVFSWTKETYSTISIIMTTAICLLILVQVAKPYVWWKRLVVGFVIFACLLSVVLAINQVGFINDFLKLVPLETIDLLFLLLMMQSALPVMELFSKLIGKVKVEY